MNSKKILLVEDDPKVCAFINKGLSEDGFEISISLNGNDGLAMALQNPDYDLLILDIMLPGIDGLSICKTLREKGDSTPILFLTALGSSENIALGLNNGADDYLVKPFKFIELTARINSLLRRSSNYTKEQNDDFFTFNDITLNDTSKTVSRNNINIKLTSTEYALLLMFIKRPHKVFSREEILKSVWGHDFDIGTNVIDVYVNYLRKKLEINNSPRLIHTVIGMGYILKEPDEDTN